MNQKPNHKFQISLVRSFPKNPYRNPAKSMTAGKGKEKEVAI
jgi:hypothetical protein